MKKKIALAILVAAGSVLLLNVSSKINNQIKTEVLRLAEQKQVEEASKWSFNERYQYELISQDEDVLYLDPGEEESLKITLKNKGKSSWLIDDDAINQVVFGHYGSNHKSTIYDSDDENWIDPETYKIEDQNKKAIIEPEDTISFHFNIKASDAPGVYKEDFRPLITGYKWISNQNISWDIVVGEDFTESYNYEIQDDSNKTVLAPGKSKELELSLKNTGKTTWYQEGQFPVKLIEEDEIYLVDLEEKEVMPGETGTFKFDITAPKSTVEYKINLQLSIPDLFVLEAKPLNIEVKVTNKLVALTFDDGYGNIDAFLDVLKEENVKATFFMLGVVAQNNPDAMKRIVEEGHLLACHSYNHPDFRGLSATGIRSQLDLCRNTIIEATDGYDPYPYFRYPYGARNAATNKVLEEEGWLNFHWTNGTGDFKYHASSAAGRKHILYYSTLNPPDHANVLMHIISKSSLAVLPDIIDRYHEMGYEVVTVADF